MQIDSIIVTADAVDEAKTYVRIDGDEEDGTIAAFVAAAIRQCEAYTGHLLIRRGVVQRLPVSPEWQRLSVSPVASISGVIGIPAEGATFGLAVGAYMIDIDHDGDGWVRVTQPGAAGRIDVGYSAGLAARWAGLDDPLRQGILRLTAHLHAYRDSPDDGGPPAAVTALWRPFRRMRISRGPSLGGFGR
jgi:uncharacterized phiE125 gp8 family phage protein